MERLVVPFRDFFGAIFFFSFGLSINPFTWRPARHFAAFRSALRVDTGKSASPLLAKESERIYDFLMKLIHWRPKRKRKKEEEAEVEVPEA